MVRVQRLTGMRRSELLGLSAEIIDRSDPEWWVYRPRRHKTSHHGKPRVISIGPKAIAILAPRLLRAGTGRLLPDQA